MHPLSPHMQDCIAECLRCYQTCRRDAMNHCLETGARPVEPRHFRMMMMMTACAEICRTAADFTLMNSDMHDRVCAACAQVCEACAQDCARLDGMDECVQACRRCADSCRRMASASATA